MKVAWEMLDCTKRYSIGSTLEQKNYDNDRQIRFSNMCLHDYLFFKFTGKKTHKGSFLPKSVAQDHP